MLADQKQQIALRRALEWRSFREQFYLKQSDPAEMLGITTRTGCAIETGESVTPRAHRFDYDPRLFPKTRPANRNRKSPGRRNKSLDERRNYTGSAMTDATRREVQASGGMLKRAE